MHAIAGNLTPVGPRTGIETLEADTFRLECFQTPTGIKFLVRVAQLVGKIRIACSDSHARRCWQSRASRRWMRSCGKYTLSILVTAPTISLSIFLLDQALAQAPIQQRSASRKATLSRKLNPHLIRTRAQAPKHKHAGAHLHEDTCAHSLP